MSAAATRFVSLVPSTTETLLALGADDPRAGAATALAFVVALAGLFVPQIQKWLSRGR